MLLAWQSTGGKVDASGKNNQQPLPLGISVTRVLPNEFRLLAQAQSSPEHNNPLPAPPPPTATEFEAEESPSAPGFGEALGKRGNRGERDARLWALDASKFTPLKKEPSAFLRLHQNDKCKRKLYGGTEFKKGGRGEVVSPCVRRGNQTCPGKFAGALGCPRLRRTVVYKLVSGFRAETPPLVLEAFRSGREGQTNQSLATLSLRMALRFTTVFT